MSTEPFANMSVTSAQRLDRLCWQFEKNWQSGDRPGIEDFLAEASEAERSALLKELLYLELEFRRHANESVRLDDYLDRFPTHVSLVTQVWDSSSFGSSGKSAPPQAGDADQHPDVNPGEADRKRTTDQQVEVEEHTPPASPFPKRAGKYEIVAEIARGGMGTVLRALDPDFQRTLAVKMMLSRYHDRPELESRFFEEAQITGQLQHPGIPPVHELGRLEDGRPFFAMKLIDGQTLDHLLKERPDPSTDLPRLLSVFEQVCQAIAYAHSRKIIHRDLKPLNVMVGAFGEVQVMDWGLAKPLVSDLSAFKDHGTVVEPSDTTPAQQLPDLGGTVNYSPPAPEREYQTAAGVVMGTPGYMAPEQARGDIHHLDERCDVFSLGAILCRILTGKPPFYSQNVSDVLTKARWGDVNDTFGLLDRCGADAELVDLCKKCLAPDRQDRPRQAGEVALAVEQYGQRVQQRLRQAELAKAQARTKALEERKRRRVSLALALVVVLFVIAVSGASIWYFQDQANRRTAAQLAEQQRQSDKREAEGRITPATNDCEQLVNKLVADLRHPQRFYRLMSKLDEWDRRLATCEAHINTAVGVIVRNPEPIDVALKQRVDSLRRRVAEERNNFAICAKLDEDRLKSSTATDGKYHPSAVIKDYRETFRSKLKLDVEHGDPETIAAQIRDKSIRLVLVAHLDHWAITAIHAKYDPNAPSRKQLAASRDWLLSLAALCDENNTWRNQFRTAYRLRDKKLFLRLATTLDPREQNPHIVAAFAYVLATMRVQAPEFLDRVSSHYLDDYWLQSSLGLIATDPSNKVGFYRAALAVRDSAQVHYNLGVVYEAKGERLKAAEHYRNALVLDAKYARAYNNLGNVYHFKGEAAKAIAMYHKAIAIDPKYALAHFNLGIAHAEKKEWAKAIEHYRKALASDSKLADAHYSLAKLYEDTRDWVKAVEHYREALALDPYNVKAHYNLGNVYVSRRDREKAIFHLAKAAELDPKNAMAHNNLGSVYASKGDIAKAMEHFAKAVAQDPKLANAHANLGLAYGLQQNQTKAIEHCRKALALDPKFAKVLNPKLALAHYILGNAYADKKEFAKAVFHYTEVVDIDPNNFFAHYNLGTVYGEKNEPAKALVHFTKASSINPRLAKPYLAIGQALLQLGKFAEAQKTTRRSLPLVAPNSQLRGRAERQLRECESLILLEKKLEQFDQNKTKPKNAQELLRLAWLCQRPYQKRYPQAVAFYQDAFRADSKVEKDLTRQHRYNAACAAALVVAGQGEDAGKLDDKKKGELRRQALAWLSADLQAWEEQLKAKPLAAVELQQYCEHAQNDPDLASVRDAKALATMTKANRIQWQKMWADMAALQRKARAAFLETTHKGKLTDATREQPHNIKMTAGHIYLIDMQSTQFDTFLLLRAPSGRLLAKDDDGGAGLNSRMQFTAKNSGSYQIMATSYAQRGRGAYTLRIREFKRASGQ